MYTLNAEVLSAAAVSLRFGRMGLSIHRHHPLQLYYS